MLNTQKEIQSLTFSSIVFAVFLNFSDVMSLICGSKSPINLKLPGKTFAAIDKNRI